ncbi:MAG: hypothetical protein JO078_11985 [Candidatus Eremiobacteraeota bacterium]|nr:hypothetical protein [Candidatus Eremiobacteraeota bacterium]MBV9700829.1 hypothetical protein [Candidatus Eremiobacteraeota bacterium]
MHKVHLTGALVVAALFFSACTQTTGPAGPMTPSTTREALGGRHTSPMIYSVEEFGFSVNAYLPSANGNAAPALQIAGSQTKLYEPQGMAVDSAGKVAVANSGQDITLYRPGANGNVAPMATITCGGPDFGDEPYELAYDQNGALYALYVGGYHASVFSIQVYDRGQQSGCIHGTHIITGNRVRLYGYGGLTVANGMIYNSSDDSIDGYHTTDNGNVSPSLVIRGSRTRLQQGMGMAVDASGAIYVANRTNVLVFGPGAQGNVAPVAVIAGKKTGIPTGYGATAIALDSTGEIFVAVENSQQVSAILVFAKGANGNVKPIRTIQGDSTGLTYIPEMGFKP